MKVLREGALFFSAKHFERQEERQKHQKGPKYGEETDNVFIEIEEKKVKTDVKMI